MVKSQPSQQAPLPVIARKFIEHKLINEQTAHDINKNALRESHSFYLQAIEQTAVSTATACELAAAEFGIPTLEFDSINMELAPLHLVAPTLLEKHHVLPVYLRGSKLLLAVGDPNQGAALDEIRFNTNLSIHPVLVDPRKLVNKLRALLDDSADLSLSDIVSEEGLDDIDLSAEVDEDEEEIIELKVDTPIVRFVNKVLQDAIRRSASDIHIEPYERNTRIRYRIDGILHEALSPPSGLVHKIIARLKILSSIDISERRIPQDGRMKLKFSHSKVVDFRVSTMPTLFGEKMVIRVLDTGVTNLGLESIGMEPEQLESYRLASRQPHGMILVTGPTGSGKTVTLYSAIKLLNTPEQNISSVEDPVEINVNGVNQVNINEKAGLTFATALRAFLRQDPDILMVGEIRDMETAEIAIKAAQTGHMVLSTLHTNDAASSLTRLVNMGVAPFNISSSVNLIIAQRLIRRLCDGCRESVKIPDEALINAGFNQDELSTLQLYEATGCSGCTGGYRGRTGIYEVMPVTTKIANMVMKNATTHEIKTQARKEGVMSMRQSGLIKISAGITTLAEVERVTKN